MSEGRQDYFDFKELQGHRAYQKLQALWAHEYAVVMKSLQFAASRNNESNWRFQAGILKGFDLAIGQLERALVQIEKDSDVSQENGKTNEEILRELKGEKA